MAFDNLKNLVKTTALAALPLMGTQEAGATTVKNGTGYLVSAMMNGDALTLDTIDPRVSDASAFGQTRIIPQTGDKKTDAAQVYAVSENFARSCMVGGGAVQKHAFQPEVFKQVVTSGTIDSLFDGSVDAQLAKNIKDLRFNAPYVQYVENGDRAFFRIQMGFPVDQATVNVGGKNIDVTGAVENSGYTLKVTDATTVATLKQAYLSGEEIRVAGTSKHNSDQPTTTMAYSFVTQGGELAQTFQSDCLDKLNKVQIPANVYVSVKTTPVDPKEMPADFKETILGSQCLRDVKPEDVSEIHVVEGMTGAISPFSYAVKLTNGDLVIGDYFSQQPDGDIRVSASWQQLDNHSVNSCAGKIVAPKEPPFVSTLPPVTTPPLVTAWVPPTTPVPSTPGTIIPPVIGGCITGCYPTPNPEPEVPAPVSIPGGGLLLLSALGMAATLRRRDGVPAAAPGANTPSMGL